MSREHYNTDSKKRIFDEVSLLKSDFTVKDIHDVLESKGYKYSITTLYRVLNSYVDLGYLKRFYNDKNTASYQYISSCSNDNHFFLKCLECGEIIHVDCDCINNFSDHIFNEHNFSILNNNLFITGYCSKCKEKL